MAENWTPQSWRRKIIQVPEYLNANKLETVENILRRSPPLVFAGEARSQKIPLAELQMVRHFFYKAVIVPGFRGI